MKLRLDSARHEPFRWHERLEIEAAELDPRAVGGKVPVDVRGVLSSVEPDFLLDLEVDTQLAIACDRCLEPIASDVSGRLQLVLIERGRRRSGKGRDEETELTADDLNVVEVGEEGLEVEPLVREQIALELPVKPLCREECAGLCPVCGANRNDGACGCEQQDVDPRWAALAALKGRNGA